MDKETLSNYGWIVICVLVLAVMLAFATPFGNFIAGAIKSTTAGLFDVNQGALGVAGITIPGQNFEEDDTNSVPNGSLRTVYEEGDYIYYRYIESGNEFGAQTLEEAKILCKEMLMEETGLSWGDFLTMYQQMIEEETNMSWENFIVAEGFDGYTPEDLIFWEFGLTEDDFEASVLENEWSVSLNLNVTNKEKTSYGPILSYIDGVPVTTMYGTFRDCVNLTNEGIPEIPNTITTMQAAFTSCMSLTDLRNLVIPDSVTNLNYCFSGCDYLIYAPEMPKYLVDMGYAFFECDRLVNPPSTVPSTVVDMQEAFNFCKALTTAPDMSNAVNVTNLRAAFGGCRSMVLPPDLSVCTKITNMKHAFADCSSMTTAPVVHSGVTDMYHAFRRCYALTGTVTINANPEAYDSCFMGMDFNSQNLMLAGTSSMLDEIGATGINYCAECNGRCHGSH